MAVDLSTDQVGNKRSSTLVCTLLRCDGRIETIFVVWRLPTSGLLLNRPPAGALGHAQTGVYMEKDQRVYNVDLDVQYELVLVCTGSFNIQ